MHTTIDKAYEILQRFGPEYGPMEFANHGPMAAEALVALGRDDAVLGWVERYAQQLGPRPEPGERVTEANWRVALGDARRFRDWSDFFDAELESSPWQSVLDRWSTRLAPGMIGAALHGILRAAHATRAVAAQDNRLRRHELAQGLAYWAASFHELPGEPCGACGGRPPAAALRSVPLLPLERRLPLGSIDAALRPLADFAPFRPVIDLVDGSSANPAETLSGITEAFAASFLANVSRPNLIALVHFITGPSSVRLLFPHVSQATAQRLLAYAWQAGAALHCVYATVPEHRPAEKPASSRDELIERSIALGDEHGMKFVEACLREEATRPSPAFRAAADDALTRLAAGW